MKVIKYEFNVGTRYVGSTVTDEIEMEFDDDATEEEIENEVSSVWLEWRGEQCDGGWKILSEEIINNDDGEGAESAEEMK